MLDTLSVTTSAALPTQGGYKLSQLGLSSWKVVLVLQNNTESDMLAGDSIQIAMSYNNQELLTYSLTLQSDLEKDSATMLPLLDEYVLIAGITQLGCNDICYQLVKYNETTVNDEGYCVVFELNSTVSIEENALSMAKVYPNPVRNTLTIDNVADANISIYSITGQLVKTIPAANGSIQVDMSAMAAGLYIVKMENGKQTRIEKIQVVK
ncbi:MAG: T9SS type A sorting domain-containing protein [Bacteroidales bacterium]|nr:T9SS type A sorting domain-containing protein [Bacteroidales bacterium]